MLIPLTRLYREAGRYALACPWLFLVPVAAEAAQHAAEYAQGFYDGLAQAKAAEASPLRLGLGGVKLLAVLLAGYWMVRWLNWGEASRVAARDPAAARRFLPLLVVELAVQAAGLFLIYGSAHPRPALLLAAALGPFLVGLLLADWQRAAPLGEAGGPVSSIRRVWRVLPWALGFTLLAFLPVMAVHYALGFGAIAGHGPAKWLILAADTALVGYLSAVLAGVPWFISERARIKA